jgi:hypothetical protein
MKVATMTAGKKVRNGAYASVLPNSRRTIYAHATQTSATAYPAIGR